MTSSTLPNLLEPDGLENGTVKLYYGKKAQDGEDYQLRSIMWRVLDNGVAVAAYNTPKKLHSFAPNPMMETFVILEHAKRDPNVRVLIWTATGPKAFSSGAAVKGADKTVHVPIECILEYSSRRMAPSADFVLESMTRAFWDFPKPLILAVNGLAVGGAANIALCNFGDLVLCSTAAKFMYPFAKLGFTPELGSSIMLPFLIGMAKAKELFMCGDWFTAEQAKDLGLVNEVLAPEKLLPRAVEVASEIAKRNPETMTQMKKVLNAPLRDQLDAVLKREQEHITASLKSLGGWTGSGPPGQGKTEKSKL